MLLRGGRRFRDWGVGRCSSSEARPVRSREDGIVWDW